MAPWAQAQRASQGSQAAPANTGREGALTAEVAALPLGPESVAAGGRGTATAEGLEQGGADPRLYLKGYSGRRHGGGEGETAATGGQAPPPADPAAPPRAALTSALPQTQPDGSAQASAPTLRAPGPWKRRRPAGDARNAARSSSRVNVCGRRRRGGDSG